MKITRNKTKSQEKTTENMTPDRQTERSGHQNKVSLKDGRKNVAVHSYKKQNRRWAVTVRSENKSFTAAGRETAKNRTGNGKISRTRKEKKKQDAKGKKKQDAKGKMRTEHTKGKIMIKIIMTRRRK